MIPGFLITWVTFPGVIVHELAHAIFCKLFGLKIFEVKYFQFATGFGQPAGYVVHGRSQHAWQDIFVSVGPFFINTIVGAVIAAPAAMPILQFHGGDAIDWVLMWLGVSIAMHAFPSTGDAKSIWHTITAPNVPVLFKAIGIPVIGLIYIGALGSMFWLDVLYGIAVAGFLPNLIIKALA
jgi:hypothetical protein